MKGVSPSAWRSSANRWVRTASTDQSALARKWCSAWGSAWTVVPRRGSDLCRVSASSPRCKAVNCSKCRTLWNKLRYWAQYWSMKATVGVAGRTRVMATPPTGGLPCIRRAQHDRTGMRGGQHVTRTLPDPQDDAVSEAYLAEQ